MVINGCHFWLDRVVLKMVYKYIGLLAVGVVGGAMCYGPETGVMRRVIVVALIRAN